jgi:hypothetical protein
METLRTTNVSWFVFREGAKWERVVDVRQETSVSDVLDIMARNHITCVPVYKRTAFAMSGVMGGRFHWRPDDGGPVIGEPEPDSGPVFEVRCRA